MSGFFNKTSGEEYKVNVIKWLDERYNRRIEKENELKQLVGNREKKSLLYRLDKMLEYSGAIKVIQGITAELYIYYVGVITVAVGIIIFYFSSMWYLAFIGCLLIPVLAFLIIYILSGVYYNALERNIMTFLNLIENFNKSEDDIVQIIRRTVIYIDEPLKSLLRDFCNDAKMSGDTRHAFEKLESRVEHDKCRELLRNIEVCSRYDSDYGEVIRDCRASMSNYLSTKSERKAIIANGRTEVIILLISAAAILMLFDRISSDMWTLLTDSFIGNCLLFYCGVVIIICIVMMILFDKNGG
ncbi:MAG: hypothetical protein E7265_00690 [Lachnospiraceae bacterium]|nr:hypothetical protein [Lachnospiraceae bacterium]